MYSESDEKWIQKLAEQARILGEARMLRDEDQLTDEKRKLVIERFTRFLEDSGRNQSWAAKSLGISTPVLSQVCAGTCQADDEKHIRAMDKWTELQLSRAAAPKPPGFVRTSVAGQIYGVAKWILNVGGIGVIHGPAGCGKTITAQAIRSDTPASIYISIRTAGQSKLSVLESLCAAIGGGSVRLTSWQLNRHLESVLGESSGRLIIVDEIHKLAGRRNDEALHALRDLHDATNCPMLWFGMTKIAQYIQEGNDDGHDPLSQIYSRVTYWLNLTDAANRVDGGPGLVTVDDVTKFFAAQKIRLTPDAVRFLQMLANEPKIGGYRAILKIAVFAQGVLKDTDKPIDAATLRSIQRQRLGKREAERIENLVQAHAAVG